MLQRRSFSIPFFRVVFVLALFFTTFMALVSPDDLPLLFLLQDKLQHGIAFVTLACLCDRSFPRPSRRLPPMLLQALLLLGYGFLLEWLQSFTSYREASFNDVIADAIGIATYWTIGWRRRRTTPIMPP